MEEIIYYDDNPNLNRLVVETHDGRKEYRENCRKIKHAYYIKNKTCFEINGVWYRIDSNLIIFNYSTNQWVLSKNHNLMQGIVSFQDGAPVLGHFDQDPLTNVFFQCERTGNILPVLNASVCDGVAQERISDGLYYLKVGKTNNFFGAIKNIVNHKDKGYNIEDNVDEFAAKIAYFEKFKTNINKDVLKYSKYLEDITFGAELESIAGYLPNHLQYQLGTVICRDGSLHAADGTQGPEYTTIPMTGAKGVQTLIDLCKELSKRNVVDHHCSMHFHIGNIPTSRLFMVTLYKLALMIQDDLFLMFPHYKTDERNLAGKDKNYCAKLEKLGSWPLRNTDKDAYDSYIYDNYLRIFTFLSGNVPPSKQTNRTVAKHPKADKWNRHARYHWLNLINTIFSKRNTVEFRIHQGTLNPQKVVTWLFICNAIIKTAMYESHKILKGEKITLEDVLNYYGKFYKNVTGMSISTYLVEYYKGRAAEFAELRENGDVLGIKEVNQDKSFFFEHSSFVQIFK